MLFRSIKIFMRGQHFMALVDLLYYPLVIVSGVNPTGPTRSNNTEVDGHGKCPTLGVGAIPGFSSHYRSQERRVGKEFRSRGSPSH